MGCCKDCKWWDHEGAVKRVEARQAGLCGLINREVRALSVDSRAFLWYEEGSALFYTAPDFGCVQFEARDA